VPRSINLAISGYHREMCCFSPLSPPGLLQRLFGHARAIKVSATRMFARLDGAAQFLVYAMALDVPADVAMVLPLPAARAADDALSFIDLSECPALFDQLETLFPNPEAAEMYLAAVPQSRQRPQTLVVHQVGSFEASYVPSLGDMARLDRRFRIPDEVWRELPQYRSYGFAVFKLKKGAGKIHPMAMKFETAEPGSLFFPTVHVHDGKLHPRARFDHALFFQTQKAPTAQVPAGAHDSLQRANLPVSQVVSLPATRGIVVDEQPVFRIGLRGTLENTDTRVALA
jgi:hypothetical protein